MVLRASRVVAEWFRQRGVRRSNTSHGRWCQKECWGGGLVLTVSIDDGSEFATASEYYVLYPITDTQSPSAVLWRLLCVRVSSETKHDDGAMLCGLVNTILSLSSSSSSSSFIYLFIYLLLRRSSIKNTKYTVGLRKNRPIQTGFQLILRIIDLFVWE